MSGNGQASNSLAFKVNIIVEPDEESFRAYCPALKGLHTCGDTKEEALDNAVAAAMAYLQSLIKPPSKRSSWYPEKSTKPID